MRKRSIHLHVLANFIPVSHWHEYVGKHQVRTQIGDFPHGCFAVANGNDFDALIFQGQPHHLLDVAVIVRDQDLRPAAKPYQGKIFFRPFFFLLVDSFLLSLLDFPSCAAASVLAASLVCPAAAGVSPVLLGSAGWPVAAGVASVLGVVSAVPFAEFSVVGGAFGSPVAAGPASPPSVAGVTLSALLVVPLVLPGVTVATIPVVVAPCDGLPPLNISIPVS